MQNKLSDKELINELQNRFQENQNLIEQQKVLLKELQKANEKLQASEALKSNFLSNIRNEINNPLAAIMGFARQLAQGPAIEAEKLKKIGNMVFNEAFSLDFQLCNIFMAAELEAGEALPESIKIALKPLISDLVSEFANRIEAKQLKTLLHFSPEEGHDWYFHSDPTQIRFIIANLLSNAIAFSNDGDSIEIWVALTDDGLKIGIKDYGPGIAPAYHQLIFDRFFQLDRTLTKAHTGNGLGLAIVKALVEQQGGHLNLESAPGKGSLFSFWLPEMEADPSSMTTEGGELLFEIDALKF